MINICNYKRSHYTMIVWWEGMQIVGQHDWYNIKYIWYQVNTAFIYLFNVYILDFASANDAEPPKHNFFYGQFFFLRIIWNVYKNNSSKL